MFAFSWIREPFQQKLILSSLQISNKKFKVLIMEKIHITSTLFNQLLVNIWNFKDLHGHIIAAKYWTGITFGNFFMIFLD